MHQTGEDLLGLEAGYDAGLVELLYEGPIGLGADDDADVPGTEEAVQGHVAGGKQGPHRRDDQLVAHEHGEVIDVVALGLQDGGRRGRGRGFEADAKEDDLSGGMFAGDLQ